MRSLRLLLVFVALVGALFLVLGAQACNEPHARTQSLRSPTPPLRVDPDSAGPLRLSSDCPPAFQKKRGKCFYNFYYARSDDSSGLRRRLVPFRNGLDPLVMDLGRYLFFDPLLSHDKQLSCAHCHHPSFGLSDGRARAMGAGGRGLGPARQGGAALERSAPSLWNVAFMQRLFWDGRSATLEHQAEGPLFSKVEMGRTRAGLRAALNGNATYRRMFARAFRRPASRPITIREVVQALADFQRSLISFNSRYDRYVQGQDDALTPQELAGFNVFRSFVSRCTECHTPPLFTNHQLAIVGAPESGGRKRDRGTELITGQKFLRGAFRVPSLRNIGRTAPYMHSGGIADLDGIMKFYNEGGGRDATSYDEFRIHWHVRKMGITAEERKAVVAFLHTLTDEGFRPSIPARNPSGLPVLRAAE